MYKESFQEKLYCLSDAESRSISAENPTGEKGKGGMAMEGLSSPCARELGQGWKISPFIKVEYGKETVLADIQGPGIIKHIWITDSTELDRQFIFRVYYDGGDKPSVEAPLGDFFAAADYNKKAPWRFAQLTSEKVCVNPARGLNCFWEMPFYKRCRITLENIYEQESYAYYQIDYVLTELPKNCAYFHAQFRRENPTKYKVPYTILDNIQGRGHYVGTYLYWGVKSNGWWGEGEMKFYIDGDKDFPTICGTGTEDYFGGAYNFDVNGYKEFCTPYMGLSKVVRPDGCYLSQQRFSMYRWHIVDPIYFKKDIRVTVQALGWRSQGRYLPLQDDISSVAFWYQEGVCQMFPPFPSANDLEIN